MSLRRTTRVRTVGLLALVWLSLGPLGASRVDMAMAQAYLGHPGASGTPRLVAIDAQNIQLWFSHFYLHTPDAIGSTTLQKPLTNGTWAEVTFAPIHITTLGSSRVARSAFPISAEFFLIYFHHDTNSIRMVRYMTGGWTPAVMLLSPEDLQNYGSGAIQDIQAVVDSNNYLHLVWQRHFEVIENGTLVDKLGVYYSKYNGETASLPERVVTVDYNTNKSNATYFDPCAVIVPPCLRIFLTIDSQNRLVLTWFLGPTYFATKTPVGWTDPIRVDTAPYPDDITVRTEFPRLVQVDLPLLDVHMDSKGVLYFFYTVVAKNEQLFIIKYQEGDFTPIKSKVPARRHSSSSLYHPMKLFDVERDSTDKFHFAYIGPDVSGALRLFYQTFKEGFSAPIMVSEAGGSEVDLSIDTKDTPHLVWRQTVSHEELFYTRQTEIGWQPPVQVTNGTAIDHQFGWIPPVSSSTTSVSEGLLVAEAVLLTSALLILHLQNKKKRNQD